MNYIEALKDVIQKMHKCEARHKESVPVNEQFKGHTVWQGVVEVFELINHPKAKICYAWGQHAEEESIKSRYMTVLGIPPVDSPAAAVRMSIVSDLHNKTVEFIDADDKIHKVIHPLEKNGKHILCKTDLQFDEGVPYVVLEWLNTPEGEVPSIRVPLDPQYLHKINPDQTGGADFTYERPVSWPKNKET
jgi:hypothetical protein